MPLSRRCLMIQELNARSRDIFKSLVDAYMETGEPVGSRTLARRMGLQLSPATIRNTMADLELAGLLYAPHISAGRVPTDAGLRLFVDGLLEVGDLSDTDRRRLEAECAAHGRSLSDVLSEATNSLSGLSACAGLVVAPKTERPLRHLEFVPLGADRALVVLVTQDGLVENRVLELPPGIPAGTLAMAGNYLTARLAGRTIEEARSGIAAELDESRAQLDSLTRKVVEAGLASWTGRPEAPQLILRGTSKLLDDVTAIADLERIRALFDALETRETMMRLLDATRSADGTRIFIGAENALFGHTGCTVVISPYLDSQNAIVGAIGVIGPTRMNYARIIPMVDYTAKLVGRLMG